MSEQISLDSLNAMPAENARAEFLRCCASKKWASAMEGSRPFTDRQHLFRAAQELWWNLAEADWLEAFSHHPRIGERSMERAVASGSHGWSKSEQAGLTTATDQIRTALIQANEDYEARFGFVFLICAAGKSAQHMLAELQSRMHNELAAELRIAAQQQALITRLRLEKLLQS